MPLENKVCLITGRPSARGIDRAAARLFAADGARVVVLDLDAGALPTLHERYGLSTDAMAQSIPSWL